MWQPHQASKHKQNVYEKSLPGKSFSVRISVKQRTPLFPLKVSEYSACQNKSDKLSNEISLKAVSYTSLLLFLLSLSVPMAAVLSLSGKHSVSHWLGQQLPLQLPTHILQNATSSSIPNCNRGTCWESYCTLEMPGNTEHFWQECPTGKCTSSLCLRSSVISPCKPLWPSRRTSKWQEADFTLQ